MEKYISFSLNMHEGMDSASVFGYVRRFDNGLGVNNALIIFAYQRAKTNDEGFYQLHLKISSGPIFLVDWGPDE